jgi:hypothetical protein
MNNSEIYILCNENDMTLEHQDETNNFKLTFFVKEKFQNVSDLVEGNSIFALLYELNKDIILNYIENFEDNINKVVYKINTNKINIFKEFADEIYLFLNYIITKSDNKTILSSKIKDTELSTNNKNYVYLINYNTEIYNNITSTKITINFTLNKKINNISNKFVALYMKKIFYKLKQYFDMV